jgi:hypothetical protein
VRGAGFTVVYVDRFVPDDEKKRARETGEEAQAIPLRIRLRKGSASKVAGFYSATRDRVMPPLLGLLLLRRVHVPRGISAITSSAASIPVR